MGMTGGDRVSALFSRQYHLILKEVAVRSAGEMELEVYGAVSTSDVQTMVITIKCLALCEVEVVTLLKNATPQATNETFEVTVVRVEIELSHGASHTACLGLINVTVKTPQGLCSVP